MARGQPTFVMRTVAIDASHRECLRPLRFGRQMGRLPTVVLLTITTFLARAVLVRVQLVVAPDGLIGGWGLLLEAATSTRLVRSGS